MSRTAEALGPIRTEEVPCAVCSSRQHEPFATGRDYFNHCSDQTFQMVRCRECGHYYLNPRPVTAELERIYPEDDYYAYRLSEESTKGGGNGLLARYVRWRHGHHLKPFVKRFGADSPLRILDLGCGDGTALDRWREAFRAEGTETHGLELSPRAAAVAESKGHLIVSRRVEEAEFEPASFDVVVSSYLIEHLADPRAFLTRCREWVKPNGLVVLALPVVDSLDHRLFRRSWGMYGMPQHWNLMSDEGFRRLVAEAGLSVESIRYRPNPMIWVWSLHNLAWEHWPRFADRWLPMNELFYRGSFYNFALLAASSAVDRLALLATGRSSDLHAVLTPT